MLVARRDPFHPGAHDTSHPEYGHSAPRAPGIVRTFSALQMIGTLLAIPVGIGSGYSIYRANFSVETTCQRLRGNIVSMLDKSVDARTRHMLVRRDVETFEQTCGSIDPDATAAFKALLASDRAVAARPRVEPKPVEAKPVEAKQVQAKPIEEKPKEVVRKPEAQEPVAAKPKPAERDASVSDAAWLAAVRDAMTSSDAAPAKQDAHPVPVSAPAVVAAPPPAREALPKAELRASLPPPAPAVSAPPAAAPVLPPPATIATVPASPPDANHPVPPASVPAAAETERHEQTRSAGWVGQIPFVGQMLAK
jgi:hypothetical protein